MCLLAARWRGCLSSFTGKGPHESLAKQNTLLIRASNRNLLARYRTLQQLPALTPPSTCRAPLSTKKRKHTYDETQENCITQPSALCLTDWLIHFVNRQTGAISHLGNKRRSIVNPIRIAYSVRRGGGVCNREGPGSLAAVPFPSPPSSSGQRPLTQPRSRCWHW